MDIKLTLPERLMEIVPQGHTIESYIEHILESEYAYMKDMDNMPIEELEF